MLELAREKLVEFTQNRAFAPIYVRMQQSGTEPGQECLKRRCSPRASR